MIQALQYFRPYVLPWSQTREHVHSIGANILTRGKIVAASKRILVQRKFMRRKKVEVFKDAAEEALHKNCTDLMAKIEETGSAVPVLRLEILGNEAISRDLFVGVSKRFKQQGKWKFVAEILEWLRAQHRWNFSKFELLMLITAYGKVGDFKNAEAIQRYMSEQGYAPNLISHTALMEAYGRAGECDKAEAVFRRMQHFGPEPSPLTYQIILRTFVEGNEYQKAEEIFETILYGNECSLKPDQQMFHMMIYMYMKAGNSFKAREVFEWMEQRGIERSTVTYNSLMSFENDYREVEQLFYEMQHAGFEPDVISYALLVHAYGKARKEEDALIVFEDMLDAGVRPTLKAYNILLDAFAISGMVDQAETVFSCMKRDRYPLDICTCTTMLTAYINASKMGRAEQFLIMFPRAGLEPNVVTYGAMINGYARANNVSKMLEKYEEMRDAGVQGNERIYTAIVGAYGKMGDFENAVFWFRKMKSSGIMPDQRSRRAFLRWAKTPEELEEAKELVRDHSLVVDTYGNNTSAFFSDDEELDSEDAYRI